MSWAPHAPPRQLVISLSLGSQQGREILTAPMSASPEPMLMTVGMMLNFPACETETDELDPQGLSNLPDPATTMHWNEKIHIPCH